MAKLLLVVVFFVFSFPLTAQQQLATNDDDTWLWEISGNGLEQPSYMFGVLRILCPDEFFISDTIKNIFYKTAQLVVEMNDTEKPNATFSDFEAILMKGKTLKDLFTPEEYADIKQIYKDSLEIDLEDGFNQSFIPINNVLAAVYFMIVCRDPESFEKKFKTWARLQNKDILKLETYSQQCHQMDSVPYDLQAKAMLRLAREWNQEKALVTKLLALYKSKSFTQAEDFINAWLGGTRDFRDILIDDKNKEWLQKIKLYAAQKPTFFAIGAGHLCGNNGIVELLKKEGYTLTHLKY